jgi:excisionase family DNA binding protein
MAPRPSLPPPLARLLRIAEVADLLQVSSKTIRRRIQDGRLRAYFIAQQWRIDPRDLQRFIEHGE